MKRNKTHIPIRTCISCGAKRNKEILIRLVLDVNGIVVRDDSGRAKGRGAYVCRSKSCLDRLGRDNRFGKAFRKEVPLPVRLELHAENWKGGAGL